MGCTRIARIGAWVAVAAVLAAGCSSSRQAPSAPAPVAPASRATSYPVPRDVERLLDDDAGFARFAGELRRDLERRLAGPAQPRDERKTDLFDLAVLDALDGDWERADRRTRDVIALEDKPAARLMTGLTIRVWARARRTGGDPAAAFRRSLEEALRPMPLDVVKDDLAVLRAMAQYFSLDACKEGVRKHIGPDAADGAIAREQASGLLFQRYAVLHMVPVGPIIVDVLQHMPRPEPP